MGGENIISIVISGLALIGSAFSIYKSNRFSKISIVHTIHELALQKAKDCNTLYDFSIDTTTQSINEILRHIKLIEVVSEIIISIQLIDRSIIEYDLNDKRSFFLLQFWTQLKTPLRLFIKKGEFNQFEDQTQKQLSQIVNEFSPFFEKY